MYKTYTLQICNEGDWQDAAHISVDEQSYDVEHKHAYLMTYAIEHLDQNGSAAASINLPVALASTFRHKPWFGYLDDILPAGASYRWWVNYLGIADLPRYQQKIQLLQHAVIAPVGNLRIKQCVEQAAEHVQDMHFSVQDVVTYNRDFLSYAQQLGAASGGATGAGGEAPKLLLAVNSRGNVWIDTHQDKAELDSTHFLVKFPRGNNTELDRDILRSEYHFYHELTELGVDTIATADMQLMESEAGPSLWLPRFDIVERNNTRVCLGVESVYSMMDVASGGLRHQAVFNRLCEVLAYHEPKQRSEFALEYLWRDVLNIAFSNTDNHGRNMAIIKDGELKKLAPVYDFAPMKFDPEVVTRSTTWGLPIEKGGEFDWPAIIDSLDNIHHEDVLAALKDKVKPLLGLYPRLLNRGVPSRILHAPTAIYKHLDTKLAQWGLV